MDASKAFTERDVPELELGELLQSSLLASPPPARSPLQHSNPTALLAVGLAYVFKHKARRKLRNAVNLNGLVHLKKTPNLLLIPAVSQAAKKKKVKKAIIYAVVDKENSKINCILMF